MDINHTHKCKDLTAQVVWDTIQNPDVLKAVLLGCKVCEEVGEEKYEAVLRSNIAPIKCQFTADVEQVDKAEPNSYRLLVKSKGNPGEINANARMLLDETASGTELTCTAD